MPACGYRASGKARTGTPSKTWPTSWAPASPELVAYSFCWTGPRLAALTVAAGARASIGFQDLVTDAQCENFFARFYRQWEERDWRLLPAFEEALRHTAVKLRGAGVILWIDRSIFASAVELADAAGEDRPAIAEAGIVTSQESAVSRPRVVRRKGGSRSSANGPNNPPRRDRRCRAGSR